MFHLNMKGASTFIFLLLPLMLQFHSGKSDIQLNYYRETCPRAEEIIKEQVRLLYHKKYDIIFAILRMFFHDCIVQGCDASLFLDATNSVISEKSESKNEGLRYFKFVDAIKKALEIECPKTVSCADVLALSAAEGAFLLGARKMEMKTGRKDALESYVSLVNKVLPSNNDTVSAVLSTFKYIGLDTEGTVALLGMHSVGRTHCTQIRPRLYPKVDPTLNTRYAKFLTKRCPRMSRKKVEYVKNDPYTPGKLDNRYYKNLLNNMGLLVVDQELVYDGRTHPFVVNMARDNGYFVDQISRAMLILSENNPLTGDDGEVRSDCRFVNKRH